MFYVFGRFFHMRRTTYRLVTESFREDSLITPTCSLGLLEDGCFNLISRVNAEDCLAASRLLSCVLRLSSPRLVLHICDNPAGSCPCKFPSPGDYLEVRLDRPGKHPPR